VVGIRSYVGTLSEPCVDLFQHPGARAKILLAELVERRLVGVEVGVEVFGVGGEQSLEPIS
jgi:hypothetical protein